MGDSAGAHGGQQDPRMESGEYHPPAELGGDGEAPVVRALRSPLEPTAKEREDHEANGHIPYTAWCRHCVAGRGRAAPHTTVDTSEDAVPIVAIDYAYFGEHEADAAGSGNAAAVAAN